MKRFLASFLAVVLPTLFLQAAEQLYTCGMHPQIIRKEPGDCPICGMRLTPVRDNAGGAGATQLHVDTHTVQLMNLKTAVVETGPVHRELRTVGAIAYDESGRRDITTKYEGWIEKLHVDKTWTRVGAGEPLFDIYSPDLYNAQLNYLVAWRGEGAAGGPLTRAATERLRLFDAPESLLGELVAQGAPLRTFTFRAPEAGVVIEKMAVQGQMMRAGEVIFRLADLSRVWVLAQVYENDLALVREGSSAQVRVTFGPERTYSGSVELLLPEVTDATRTATARIVVENSDGFLRPGMFADVRFSARLVDAAVLVPDMAVLRSGERNTVFVMRDSGVFEPREVKLGARTDDFRYEVLNGLEAGERVVTSGQFLLDSESQLREAIQKMMRDESAPPPAPAAGDGYVCPMREHTPTPLPQPGKCAICGMKLVPAKSETGSGHAH